MYRTFEHTADVGLHVEAPALAELLAEAGRALVALLVARPDAAEPRERQTVELSAERLDDLLHDYLAELLYRFDAEGFVPATQEIDAEVGPPARLRATLAGERFDAARHGGGADVKAITYHGLRVEPTDAGYTAEVIVDV